MIIGEAPGKKEDADGLPFVGPAGQLMDKMFAGIGEDTNKDWYCGNVVKCRPVAESGSSKQNYTPTTEHHKACRPYITREITYLNPHIVVLVGKTACCSLFPRPRALRGGLEASCQRFGLCLLFPPFLPPWVLQEFSGLGPGTVGLLGVCPEYWAGFLCCC